MFRLPTSPAGPVTAKSLQGAHALLANASDAAVVASTDPDSGSIVHRFGAAGEQWAFTTLLNDNGVRITSGWVDLHVAMSLYLAVATAAAAVHNSESDVFG